MAQSIRGNLYVISDVDYLADLKQQLEVSTGTKFSSYVQTKNFGSKTLADVKPNQKLIWKHRAQEGWAISSDSGPFVSMGRIVYDCEKGKDRKVAAKKKYQSNKDVQSSQDHQYIQKGRERQQHTKKLDCPAQIVAREVIHFPGYKIEGTSTEGLRRYRKKKLWQDIAEGKNVEINHLIYVYLPPEEDHKGHPTGESDEPTPNVQLDENDNEDDSPDIQKPKSAGKKSRDKKWDDSELNLISNMSENMSTLVEHIKSVPSTPLSGDCHAMWAQLLADKLNKIEDFKAEQMKVKIDSMILDVMQSDPKF